MSAPSLSQLVGLRAVLEAQLTMPDVEINAEWGPMATI
jgi:hypothetical protein